MKSTALLGSACAAVCGVAVPAFAQVSPASQPVAVSPPPAIFGDRGGDAGVFSGYRLSAPLRLSLEGSVVPKAGGFPNCASLEDDVGNSVGGIPVQHYTQFRASPRLVLSIFTQLGCPIDAGIGAALTYAVPVAASAHLVFGTGLYAAPGQLPLFGGLQAAVASGLRSRPSPVNEAARIDLVWSTKSGAPYHVGIETLGVGMQTLKFGGGF